MQGLIGKIAEKIKKDSSDYRACDDLYRVATDMLETDRPKAVRWLKWLSGICEREIPKHVAADLKKAQDFTGLHKRVLCGLSQDDFDSFLRFVEWDREPSKRFYMPRRKVLKQVVDALQELADDKLDLLAVSLPPGAGKLLADDTPVMTKDGWKRHGDLRVGDYVVGLDGKYKRVEHVFPKDVAEYMVEFTNGDSIKCHGRHEWIVCDRYFDNWEVLETRDLRKRGLMNCSPCGTGYRFVLPARNTGHRGYSVSDVCVKSIKRIPPVPGNCIQVEGGIYCAGRTMLPTHNSTLAIFYLTWLAGREPNSPILTGSHSNAFVRGVYDECLRIFDKHGEYLWHEVFPNISVSNTNAKDCRIDLDKRQRFETLEFTSIGSGNAGLYRAATLLYCDDLVSGIEVALSKERLDKLWETYTTDLRQRKIGDKCKELHIATRWSVHDVIGRLESEYSGSDRARFIVVPAMDENDESNFDYMYGVGFSTKFYREQRDIMDDASWRALYMNEPIEREGLVYNADELRRFFELPDAEPDAVIAVCDTKDRGQDYASLPIAYVYGQDYYIADCLCDNGLPDTVDARMVEILLKWRVGMARFESNNAGGRTAQKVQEGVKARGGNTHITTRFTRANKETRIIVSSSWVKEHCIFRDASTYKRNSDYGRFMDMLCNYTMSGKNKHDDVPDSMAMLSEFAQSMGATKVEVFQRPW